MTQPAVARFANINHLLVYLLEDLAGGEEHCDSETPADLYDRLPFIRVRKVDGDRDRLFDRPIVEIDAFALTELQGQQLGDEIFEYLMRVPSPHPAIDATFCSPSPRELPWADERIRRFSATYAFDLRRTKLLA